MTNNSPIIVFLYNRLEETKRTLNALSQCESANLSDLIIYIDGPKNEKDKQIQKEINNFANTLKENYLSINIIQRQKNLGLGKSIILGLNNTFEKYDTAIILEDDILVSHNFLIYCNEALSSYENTDIYHISGWSPICNKDNNAYLTNYMACWGWATWKTKWKKFEKNPIEIIQNFKRHPFDKIRFNFFNNLYGQVVANHENRINTWAVFWFYSIFKNSAWCLNPPKSLVKNIGLHSGTNHKKFNYSDRLLNRCISCKPIELGLYQNLKKNNTRIRFFYFLKNKIIKPLDIILR